MAGRSLFPRTMTSTGWALVVTNLLPLVGVFLFKWDAALILLLYWMENVIIGVINLIKLAKVKADPGGPPLGFVLPFFLAHYGIFTFVHGVFVMVFSSVGSDGLADVGPNLGMITQLFSSKWFVINLLALAVSHGFSLMTNFFGKKEYEKLTRKDQMMQPYARIIVLHIALLFGGVITIYFGNPVGVLVILIAGKIVLDLKLHNKEHRMLSEAQ